MELMHSRLCILYFWIVHSISYCFPYEADPVGQHMSRLVSRHDYNVVKYI